MCKVQNELRFFLNEFLPVSYADSKPLDLAPKPISAQLFSGISSCLTSVNQKWQGRAVRPLANAAFTIGYALNTVVALVEFVASLALATLLTQLYKSTGLLKNQTIKALGYSLHSAAIAATQVACMILGHPFLRSLYSVVSNGSHIASLTFANYFVDQEAFDQIFADSIHTFIEKGALVELLCALDRDFGVGGTNEQLQEMLSKQSLIGFVYSHEDVTNLFAEFELSDLFDPEMRALFKTIAEEFVQYSYNPVQVDFNEDVDYGDNQMDPYRKKLVEYVETACRDLKGKLEGIEDFDPSIFVPLAKYAQFLEVKDSELHCPKEFSEYLQEHNGRQQILLEAKKLYCEIAEDHFKEALQQKEVVLSEKELQLMHKIDTLAASLYKGRLMSQPTASLIQDHQASRNFFQEALQRALRPQPQEAAHV